MLCSITFFSSQEGCPCPQCLLSAWRICDLDESSSGTPATTWMCQLSLWQVRSVPGPFTASRQNMLKECELGEARWTFGSQYHNPSLLFSWKHTNKHQTNTHTGKQHTLEHTLQALVRDNVGCTISSWQLCLATSGNKDDDNFPACSTCYTLDSIRLTEMTIRAQTCRELSCPKVKIRWPCTCHSFVGWGLNFFAVWEKSWIANNQHVQ